MLSTRCRNSPSCSLNGATTASSSFRLSSVNDFDFSSRSCAATLEIFCSKNRVCSSTHAFCSASRATRSLRALLERCGLRPELRESPRLPAVLRICGPHHLVELAHALSEALALRLRDAVLAVEPGVCFDAFVQALAQRCGRRRLALQVRAAFSSVVLSRSRSVEMARLSCDSLPCAAVNCACAAARSLSRASATACADCAADA